MRSHVQDGSVNLIMVREHVCPYISFIDECMIFHQLSRTIWPGKLSYVYFQHWCSFWNIFIKIFLNFCFYYGMSFPSHLCAGLIFSELLLLSLFFHSAVRAFAVHKLCNIICFGSKSYDSCVLWFVPYASSMLCEYILNQSGWLEKVRERM